MSISPPDPDSTVQEIDPLPYYITFAVLFIIALAVLTWALGVWYKSNQCAAEPNIWCSDNWTCTQNCPPSLDYNVCFSTGTGVTGLASCLYGPKSPQATVCLTPTGPTGSVACNCPTQTAESLSNCLSNCPAINGNINPSTVCCCNPGSPGCTNTDTKCLSGTQAP